MEDTVDPWTAVRHENPNRIDFIIISIETLFTRL